MMRRSFITIFVFTAMNFVLSMVASVFNGILDKVAASLNISVADAGLLNTLYSYGAAVGGPVTLIVFRKINRVRLLKFMLLIAALSALILVTVKSFGVLLVIRFIMGIAVNSYGVLTTSLVLSIADQERQGRTMALLVAGNSLAMVVGVPLTRALSSVLGWRDIFLILVAMMATALIYFHFALHDGNPDSETDLRNEFEHMKDGRVIFIMAFTMIMFLGYGGFYTYVTPYLLELFPSFEPAMSIILVAIGIASFIGNWIGGIVLDKIGYAKSMLIGATLQFAMVLFMTVFQPVQWATLLFTTLMVMCAWFTGIHLNTGIAQVTENKSRFILSLNSSCLFLGNAIGSSLAAVVITAGGIQNIILITLATTISIILIQLISVKKYTV